MDLNKVMLIGRATADPEMRTTTGGQNVVNFSLATGRVWKNDKGEKQEKTEFHNIVAWRKLADVVGQYVTKGKQLYIEGHLQTRSWEGKDGNKRNTTEIVADNLILLGGGKGGKGSRVNAEADTETEAANEKEPSPSPAPKKAPASSPEAARGTTPATPPTEEINIEDIPF